MDTVRIIVYIVLAIGLVIALVKLIRELKDSFYWSKNNMEKWMEEDAEWERRNCP